MKSRSNIEIRRCRPLLGTFVDICVRGGNAATQARGLASAFAAVERVQRLMSFHEPSSDVSRLNREAFLNPVRVHEWTWQVLVRAQDFAVRSGGAFDVTIAPLLSEWGYLPRGSATDAAATFRDIILGPRRVIRFARPLSVDLGGIAKGFAVDCAVESLRSEGIRNGIINAGGDLRALGEEPQQVYLRDPTRRGSAAGIVLLQNRAIATSGIYFSRKVRGGVIVSPLIDGVTHRPLADRISVAVSASDCLTADALTKIVLTRREESCALLRWHEADAIVLERGKPPRVLATHAPQLS